MIKTVTIFGASGKTGRLVVADALSQGLHVRAFVHSHPNLDQHPRLTVIQGDIHDRAAVTEALRDCDAVISTLGSWGTKEKDILAAAMANIIIAMKARTVSRIISLTGADARAPGDSLGFIHRLSHFGIGIFGSKVLHDGERHIGLLAASSLDWTVIRSPIMRNSESVVYELTDRRPLPWKLISRKAVAAALLAQLATEHRSQEALFIR